MGEECRMIMMRLWTIGFTRKSASEFFAKLRDAGVRTILDVRLNNTSQLAGFAKRDDLRFFAKEILNVEYQHLPMLAPTQEMLDEHRKERGGWNNYETRFRALMKERAIEKHLDPKLVEIRNSLRTDVYCAARRSRINATEGSWRSICRKLGVG
jgi:uncharacterized protein (DUF488 family)